MTETARSGSARAGKAKGLTIERIYTTPGVHPYDEVTWELRDVNQTNWKTGEQIFEQKRVEFPEFWSVNASTIVTTKYFRGALGTPERERSLKQLIDRVVLTYVKAGKDFGYFASPGDAEVFEHELTYALLHQVFSFNSPVWFNVGTPSPQQVSACFILSVDDSMDSILNWYKEEGFIFKGGSGAGLNLSRIRSSKELLSSGGTASGPVSFMRGADASAGTIKSGGATRRAAKMVVLDVDHPDIYEFIETKAREEDKIRALRDAGFDMDLGGKDIVSVQYQNANNSVRVTDEFMRAVEDGSSFGLTSRKDGSVIEEVDARDLLRKIAEGGLGVRRPGHPVRRHHQRLAHQPRDGSDHGVEPLLRVHVARQLFVQPRLAQPAEVPARRRHLRRRHLPEGRRARHHGDGHLDLLRRLPDRADRQDHGRLPPARHRLRQPRRAAHGHRPRLRLRRRPQRLRRASPVLLTGAAYKRSAELAGVVGPYAGYARNATPTSG
jgi:ribonucleoside-diphosphate reductase alpha chain